MRRPPRRPAPTFSPSPPSIRPTRRPWCSTSRSPTRRSSSPWRPSTPRSSGQRHRRRHYRDQGPRLWPVQARLVGPQHQGSAERQSQLGRWQGRRRRHHDLRPARRNRNPCLPSRRSDRLRPAQRSAGRNAGSQRAEPAAQSRPGPRLQCSAAQSLARANGQPQGAPGNLLRHQPPGRARHRAGRRRAR